MPTITYKEKGEIKEGWSAKRQWIGFLEKVKELTPENDVIIAGDFNAFIGQSDKAVEEKYTELLEYVNLVTPPDAITYIGQTGQIPVDHICTNISVEQIRKVRIGGDIEPMMADHKPVVAEIELPA